MSESIVEQIDNLQNKSVKKAAENGDESANSLKNVGTPITSGQVSGAITSGQVSEAIVEEPRINRSYI